MSKATPGSDYDRLVGLIYQGAMEQQPWQSSLPALREAFAQPGPALIAVPVDYAENMKLTERLGNVSMRM